MAGTFNWRPDYPINAGFEPKVNEATFGDGYVQAGAYGINNNPASIDLGFTRRTQTEADAIEDFLSSKGGWERFTWVNARGQSAYVRCKRYSRVDHAVDNVEIRATFTQVYGA